MEGELAMSSNRKCSAATGSVRKTKDNAADWFNLMVRWERLNEEGFGAATNIINLRRSQIDPLPVEGSPGSTGSTGSPGPPGLQAQCSRLEDIVNKMVVVVTKMERLLTSQRGIQELDEFHFGPEGRTSPLCLTWNPRQFEECACDLLKGFHQELQLKQVILHEVAHHPPSDLGLVYLSCWLHQPYIPPQTRLTLEALLLETGHRPL